MKEYLSKSSLGPSDALEYQKYRQQEDNSEEMTNRVQLNERDIKSLSQRALDYPSALIMFLFTSGAFFILISILLRNPEPFPCALTIISVEILLVITTATNSAANFTAVYAKIIGRLKNWHQ